MQNPAHPRPGGTPTLIAGLLLASLHATPALSAQDEAEYKGPVFKRPASASLALAPKLESFEEDGLEGQQLLLTAPGIEFTMANPSEWSVTQAPGTSIAFRHRRLPDVSFSHSLIEKNDKFMPEGIEPTQIKGYIEGIKLLFKEDETRRVEFHNDDSDYSPGGGQTRTIQIRGGPTAVFNFPISVRPLNRDFRLADYTVTTTLADSTTTARRVHDYFIDFESYILLTSYSAPANRFGAVKPAFDQLYRNMYREGEVLGDEEEEDDGEEGDEDDDDDPGSN